VGRNLVVTRTTDGRIAAYDLANGGMKWFHDRNLPALTVRSLGSPSIHGDLVIDGSAAGKVLAMSLQDGRSVWETTVIVPRGRSEVERMVELDADPVLQGDIAYVTGFQAGLAALDTTSGSILWHQKTAYTSHAVVVDRKSLYVTDNSSDVWKMDLTNGADQWKQDVLHQRRLTVPARIRDFLVVGDFEGYLHLLRADNGSLVGRLEVESEDPIIATPLVFEDTLYVLTSKGVLAAVKIE
jgi:outer membrane protein assembly factor BamB